MALRFFGKTAFTQRMSPPLIAGTRSTKTTLAKPISGMATCCATTFVETPSSEPANLTTPTGAGALLLHHPSAIANAGQHHIKMLGLLAQLQRDPRDGLSQTACSNNIDSTSPWPAKPNINTSGKRRREGLSHQTETARMPELWADGINEIWRQPGSNRRLRWNLPQLSDHRRFMEPSRKNSIER